MMVIKNDGKNPNEFHSFLINNDCSPRYLGHNAIYDEETGEKVKEATEIYIEIEEEKEQLLLELEERFREEEVIDVTPTPTFEERVQAVETKTAMTTLAIKLIAPTFSDEVMIQVPFLFDEWAAEVEYVADKSIVRYEDILYRVITSHRSQADWPPSDVPALYKIIEAPGEIGPWRQPLGEHDAYQTGDKVKHKDQTWISTADDNVWEPGVHGWEIAT